MFNIPFVRVQMDHKSDFEVIPALLLLLFLLFRLGDNCQILAVRSDNCQIGQLSMGTTVNGDNCQWGQLSVGQLPVETVSAFQQALRQL